MGLMQMEGPWSREGRRCPVAPRGRLRGPFPAREVFLLTCFPELFLQLLNRVHGDQNAWEPILSPGDRKWLFYPSGKGEVGK